MNAKHALGSAVALSLALSICSGVAQGKPPASPLPGQTHDFAYDGQTHPKRAYQGRVFVHARAAAKKMPALPLLVFIHGTNAARIPFRWMGGGQEGDVRRIVSELIEQETIPPILVAGPSSTIPAAVAIARTSWPAFDLQGFVDQTAQQLGKQVSIDRTRIIVVAHSGGGCNARGGLATALTGTLQPWAAISIDTCMTVEMATVLAQAPIETHVIVSWQTHTWNSRPISRFLRRFKKLTSPTAGSPAGMRALDHIIVKRPMPHDAMVPLTLGKWLAQLFRRAKVEQSLVTP